MTVLHSAGTLCGLMIDGVLELMREIRSIGSTITEVAEYLGLAVLFLPELPVAGCTYMLQMELRQLWAEDDWGMWVGLCAYVAHISGFETTGGAILEAAFRVFAAGSGTYAAVKIA